MCALDATWTEVEWLCGLMSVIPVVSKPHPSFASHYVDKIRSTMHNTKTKRHIQVRLKSIRDLVSDRVIAIAFIGTQGNIVDPLTKGLGHDVILKSRLGIDY